MMQHTYAGLEPESDGRVTWFRFTALGPGDRLVAVASGRSGGVSFGGLASLNLGYSVGDQPDNVDENRARLFGALGLPLAGIASTRQVHGVRVLETRAGGLHGGTEGADGLVTDCPGVFLSLTFADCVPILAFDSEHGAVGLAHGGWKGTLAGIAGELIATMQRCYGSRPEAMRFALGPSIGRCCYVVGTDVATNFESRWPGVVSNEGTTTRLDLWEANRRQLLDAGASAERVALPGACSCCDVDAFFSHRAQRGSAGRFAVLLGIADAT
jgi:YfiH family protein